MTSNVGEYGQVLVASIGLDVSTNLGLEFILESKTKPKKVFTESDGVTVGAVDVTIGDTLYKANEYLSYTVKAGDLDIAGRWRKKAAAVMTATNKVVGNYERFTVLP